MIDRLAETVAAQPLTLTVLVAVVAALSAITFAVLWLRCSRLASRQRGQLSALEGRFSSVLDVEDEMKKAQEELGNTKREMEELRASYREKRELHEQLKEAVAVFDEQVAFAEFGVYEPHFEFDDSEKYKEEIRATRDKQKVLVKDKQAAVCTREWQMDGSVSKGRTMINRATRLALRAFNAESDAAIANVRWNNAEAMVRRVENARAQIDKANASLDLRITEHYLGLKLNELRLTHEYRERRKVEKEEQAEVRRLQRDEQRLKKEAEEAQREEDSFEKLLAQAREEAGREVDQSHAQRVAELERMLAHAHARTERAKSMAERTKSGFVYIISNIGSFGEDVVKIGLTRRLDPMDRVKELGDASVPFAFDTHALIYSPDAPALEAALHEQFRERRINTANNRKEFFRVPLEAIEQAVARLAPDAEFHRDIEAQEFRETIARRAERLERQEEAANLVFPEEI